MKKRKDVYLAHFFLVVTLFPLCDYMREFLLRFILGPKYWIANFNIVLFIFIIYLCTKTVHNGKFNYKLLYPYFSVIFLVTLSMIFGSYKNPMTINFIVVANIMLPLILLGIDVTKFLEIKKILKFTIRMLNIVICVVVFVGCIDYMTHGSIQMILRERYFTSEYFIEDIERNMRWFYRYYSVLGHPLRLTGIILLNYSLNLIYNKYYENIFNITIISIVSLIGISLANSKTGIVCMVSIFLISNFINKKNRLIKIIVTFMIIAIFISSSFFRDTVINRFQNTTLTTGRSEIISYLFVDYMPKPGLIGEGYKFSYYLSDIAGTGAESFEYPPIMFAYDYGIIATLLIYCIIFIYPSIIFIKRRHWFLFFQYIIVFIQFSTHAGITVYTDTMPQLIVFIYFLLNVSHNINQKANIKVS